MEVGVVSKKALSLPGFAAPVVVNNVTMIMMAICSLLVIALGFYWARRLSLCPGRRQTLAEICVGSMYALVEETLGEKARTYFPLIMTLFLYLVVCNWIGIIPGFKSPTEDLNVCAALALTVFIVAHGSGVKTKGLWGYMKGYADPFILMLPLNIIGEIGQTLSHCFRLFGNIFGGGIIFTLVPFVFFKVIASFGAPDISESMFSDMHGVQGLIYAGAYPAIVAVLTVCYSFFGLFAGTVQALVFTMLALTYISLQVEK